VLKGPSYRKDSEKADEIFGTDHQYTGAELNNLWKATLLEPSEEIHDLSTLGRF
jgi:hypothetical protein